jgi:hypothetical protein
MTALIIAFGALTAVAGIVIVISPGAIVGLLTKYSAQLGLHVLAVMVRLALGILLVYSAGASKYPTVIAVIGWLSIIAALVFAAIGRNNFKQLMSWALTVARPLASLGGILAVCFGSFLVYAFI